MNRHSPLLTITATLLAGSVGDIPACQICLPYPTESLADKVLAAEHLVLAREHPDQPFTLRAIETLVTRGEPPPVDLFLDSTSRRRLTGDEELTILCAWTREDEWQRLALFDPVIAPVVREILANATTWRADPDARLTFFADYLAHEDRRLSDLAHLEVAGAPYRELLRFADRIPREDLLARLANFRRLEWHALYILFLSQSDHPADRERIRDQIADAADFHLAKQTPAWATAFIEIDGVAAVEQLAAWYLEPTRRPEERQAVLSAITVQGDRAAPALRDAIVGLMDGLLDRDPALAPSIADTLTSWGRGDLTDRIAALLRESPERFDPPATVLLRRYLREQSASASTSQASSALPSWLVGALMLLALGVPILGKFLRRDPDPRPEASHP